MTNEGHWSRVQSIKKTMQTREWRDRCNAFGLPIQQYYPTRLAIARQGYRDGVRMEVPRTEGRWAATHVLETGYEKKRGINSTVVLMSAQPTTRMTPLPETRKDEHRLKADLSCILGMSGRRRMRPEPQQGHQPEILGSHYI